VVILKFFVPRRLEMPNVLKRNSNTSFLGCYSFSYVLLNQNHYNHNSNYKKPRVSNYGSGDNHSTNHTFEETKGNIECFICHQRNDHSSTNCPYGQMKIEVDAEALARHKVDNEVADSNNSQHFNVCMMTESDLPPNFVRKPSNEIHSFYYSVGLTSFNACVIIDTGASRSMFRERTLFSTYTLLEDIYVYTADGKPLPVLGKGTVGFIPDCFHVPALSKDLLSLPHLDEKLGLSATVARGKVTIFDPTKRYPTLNAILNPSSMLYELPLSTLLAGKSLPNTPQSVSHALLLQSKAEAINRLHDIFHRDGKRLEQMIKDGVISWDVPYKPTNFIRMQSECDACRLAKSTRKTFTGHIPPETQIGKLWFFDMWGPNETASIRGNKYIAGFIEAVTKKVFLYFLPSKKCANVTRHLVTTEIPVLRHRHGLKDFIIQSDTGEFVSREIEGILAENGEYLRHGAPYTPETQAVIERLWRTITELATTMMLAANLPEPYWEDATEYARLIYNRTIRNSGTPGVRQSPEEMYTSPNRA
jgi:hypothetical protein